MRDPTWSQLGLHRKPIGLLNVQGYFDGLLSFLDHGVEERFLRPEHRGLLFDASEARRLLEKLRSYQASEVGKWLDRSES